MDKQAILHQQGMKRKRDEIEPLETATIIVETPLREYRLTVDASMLTSACVYAEKMFKADMRESATGEWPVAEPLWVVRTFVNWVKYDDLIYPYGELEPWQHDHSYTKDDQPHTWHLMSLIELYVLANKYDTPGLRDDLVDAVQLAMRSKLMPKIIDDLFSNSGETFKWAMEHLHGDNKMRALLLNMFHIGQHNGIDGKFGFGVVDLNADELRDLNRMHVKASRANDCGRCLSRSRFNKDVEQCDPTVHAYSDLLGLSTKGWCFYHEHRGVGRERDCLMRYLRARKHMDKRWTDADMDGRVFDLISDADCARAEVEADEA